MTAEDSGRASGCGVAGLAYVDVDARDVDDWVGFATAVLGAEVVDVPNGARLKIDELSYRVSIRAAATDGVRSFGWDGGPEDGLEAQADRLTAVGRDVARMPAEECAERGVCAGLRFRDDDAFVHEIVSGFGAPGRVPHLQGVSRFVTGAMGMGHVVVRTADLPKADRTLRAMGMILREELRTAAGPGHFFGCNPRHHSIAVLACADGPPVRHLMLEMQDLDDIGAALDRARSAGSPVSMGLGRHRTDNVVSFYVGSPGGFDIEIGWGGLLVDDTSWAEVKESTRRRPWGHRRPTKSTQHNREGRDG